MTTRIARSTSLWGWLLACAVGGLTLGACVITYPRSPLLRQGPVPVEPYPGPKDLQKDDKIVVIGDVQRTALVERLTLRELNDREQILLRNDINGQEFSAVVLLGDMAFSGSDEDWEHFDALMKPLRARHPKTAPNDTTFFPVMGNHDYSCGSQDQIRKRFSNVKTGGGGTHYAFNWGNVRLIFLDGNRENFCEPKPQRYWGQGRRQPERPSRPCEDEWQAQLEWLKTELAVVDKPEPVGGAILFVHQSPYTQSPLVASDQEDARDFARSLLNSKRGLALISAHAHGFERYLYLRDEHDTRLPKDFIVSAGGGGPRPCERRKGAPFDKSCLPWPRPFNYLLLEQSASGVEVKVRGLDKTDCIAHDLDSENRSLPFR